MLPPLSSCTSSTCPLSHSAEGAERRTMFVCEQHDEQRWAKTTAPDDALLPLTSSIRIAVICRKKKKSLQMQHTIIQSTWQPQRCCSLAVNECTDATDSHSTCITVPAPLGAVAKDCVTVQLHPEHPAASSAVGNTEVTITRCTWTAHLCHKKKKKMTRKVKVSRRCCWKQQSVANLLLFCFLKKGEYIATAHTHNSCW